MKDRTRIVVCGCIGAGKTTAVRLLSSALGYEGQVENYSENPFLDLFYQDSARWAFQSQLWFLVEALCCERRAVKDSGIVKELDPMLVVEVMSREMHERGFISGEEMAMLRDVACPKQLPTPDLYLLLEADAEVLHERIHARGRPMEQNIDIGYLSTLSDRYEAVLSGSQVPVLTIPTDRIDIRAPEGLAKVLDMIADSLPPAAHFRDG